MKKYKSWKRLLIAALLCLVFYGVSYCWVSFPVATGYGAKVLCSALFVSGRSEEHIKSEELAFSPLNLATFNVNYNDSSVTCTLFGFAKRKAIFRKGLGSTLINEFSEEIIRNQPFRHAAPPGINQDTVPWPMGNKLAGTSIFSMDTARLSKAVQQIFTESNTLNPNRTRAVVVVYKDQIIAEQYAEGFTRETRLTGWSMTKSITSAIAAMLVKEGKLSLDANAPVQEWQQDRDPRRAITIRHLLQQTTGLEFEEVYSKSSHATRMLCQKADMGGYAASLPLNRAPGSRFRYSSGNSNILSKIIRQTIGDDLYHSFPYEKLFYRLGMYSVILEPDASGTFVGSSYCFSTARDWARFGLLYINEGVFNNQQILPIGWVKQSIAPAAPTERGEYGFQWWLNAGEKNNSANRMFPTLPTDMFFADGFEGQNVFVIPSKQLVVVRLGLTRKREYGQASFLREIIESVK